MCQLTVEALLVLPLDLFLEDLHCTVRDGEFLLVGQFRNLGCDPGLLFGDPAIIRSRIVDTVKKAIGRKHILNLGHGILPGTPEENARVFFETGKNVNEIIENN